MKKQDQVLFIGNAFNLIAGLVLRNDKNISCMAMKCDEEIHNMSLP